VYDVSKERKMSYDEYEYEYHDLIEDADYIDQDDDIYYDDGSDEPWMGLDEDGNESMDDKAWENYYHNLTDEIDD
jgi:hypothetical protein